MGERWGKMGKQWVKNDASDIRAFLSAGNCLGMPCQFFGRDVNLPPDNATSVLPSMRVLFPMPGAKI